ncbi:FadR/GntR family transcriptional regulator [Kineococcus arenarius]|uniref:FadR/GntR family transcriptional regulator n=1 Tax=unclassified Kineococcus TaxID=2621656 RepID=UPI003D7EC5E5
MNGGTAPERVVTLLRDRIAGGKLVPGDRLPRERDLAADLGVSRSALREAIRALAVMGLLETRHGSGTCVTALGPVDLLSNVGLVASVMPSGAVTELAEFRRLVEPPVAGPAAARATPQDLTRLEAVHAEMEQTTDPARYAELDSDFHRAVVAAAGNQVISAVFAALVLGDAWGRTWQGLTRDHVPERTRHDHADILIALQTGDSALALAVEQSHTAATSRHLSGPRTAQPSLGDDPPQQRP